MLTEEGNGKEEMEEPQKSTVQATNSPLPEAPTIKATPSLPTLQNLKKVVAIAQSFATTSKKMLHGTTDGLGAGSDLEHPNLGIAKLYQFQQPPKA